jgi:voltage-gated potassium channel
MALVAGIALLYFVLPMSGKGWVLSALAGPAAVAALVPLAVKHTRRILASDHPIADILRAIAVVLAVMIFGFAATYYAIEINAPDQIDGLQTKTDAVYFTVTTLTTVGFGDIHAAGQTARSVVTFNMISNLVLVAMVLRLFGWAGQRRVGQENRFTRAG